MSVVLEGVTKRYVRSGAPAVSAASFAAPEGSITALLGPSGSGKTTLLRIIAGLETPDTGVIRIAGQDMRGVPVRMRQVGFVFQGYALFPSMTVRQNIGFGLTIRRTPRAEKDARVDELLELVQLAGFGDRLPSELSAGQQQRVAFARALAPRPRLLLLDEPFGALDTRVRIELRAWLRELHDQSAVSTLLVTHDQDEALEVSAHVVLLDHGRVVQTGAPDEILARPATPFVSAFLRRPG